MNLQNENVIGIVGGMGPQSGLAVMDSIIRQTKATRDQEHLSTILMSFPKHLVDRTLFLEERWLENPAYQIAEIIHKLEKAGAKIVGIACNTCHTLEIFNVIIEELTRINCKVRLVNMAYETCLYVRENFPNVKHVGIAASNGSYKSGVYKSLLTSWGYDPIVPDFTFQNNVIHKMIYDKDFGIKSNPTIANEVLELLEKALTFYKDNGAEAVILGCTEFSLIAKENLPANDMIFVDSCDVLAKSLIREASKP